jgi:hypothetical protein
MWGRRPAQYKHIFLNSFDYDSFEGPIFRPRRVRRPPL